MEQKRRGEDSTVTLIYDGVFNTTKLLRNVYGCMPMVVCYYLKFWTSCQHCGNTHILNEATPAIYVMAWLEVWAWSWFDKILEPDAWFDKFLHYVYYSRNCGMSCDLVIFCELQSTLNFCVILWFGSRLGGLPKCIVHI